ncbi:MAG: diacylglycerol kinase family protein [Patescibacteria group bacterium]
MKVVLIYNVASGSQYQLRDIRKLFRSHGIAIDYSFTAKQLASKKLAVLIARGVTVAVIGGDGTINSAARLVVGTKSTLLPLPGGTFNHFVRDLGMSPNLEETLENIRTAETRKIDVAYVNDELFLNNSNIGLYPFSLIERKATKKIVGKWIAAVLSAFDQLSVFRRHKLVIDGETIRSPFVFVGNNIYDIKSSLIPQRTGFTSSTLTVMVASSRSRLALMRAIVSVVKGDVSDRDDFALSHRQAITIYSHRSTIPVSFDGEVKHLAPPLKYQVKPKVLKVMIAKAK